MKKYKWRKQYTEKEANICIDNTMQLITTNRECIITWANQIRYWKTDKLIEALCHQTTEEMIHYAEIQNLYLLSKIEYIKQFSPNFRSKSSFWFPIC